MGDVARSLLPPDLGRWWTHRRRMAYLSILGLYLEMLIASFASPERVNAASVLLICLAGIFFGIIVTYIVAATREDLAYIRNARP